MTQKTAFITGITGQDGGILAELLLSKGYKVHALRLYSATNDTSRIDHLLEHPAFSVHYGDLTDGGSLQRLISATKPDEIYNLGAQSHVQVSFEVPEATADINALGTLRLLEAIRGTATRFYQASSSEMFGNSLPPQNEATAMMPCSPYATAKLYAYHIVRNYREAYDLHASNGILFNHESPVRGEEFVTRKISRAVAAIALGQQDVLTIGNLDALRDWGHAKDYVEGMWLMLQADQPDDYVLATGQAHSVRDFIMHAFAHVGIQIAWRDAGIEETGYERTSGRTLVRVNPRFFRPNEVNHLCGDARKAREILGWRPRHSFAALVEDMVQSDLTDLKGHDDDRKDLSLAA